MGLKMQIAKIRKANKILPHEAGELEKERNNYRQAYLELLRKEANRPKITMTFQQAGKSGS